jgi:hypothetical protein
MTMNTRELFTGFTEEQQKEYEEEAARRWDPKTVAESSRRWRGYSKEQKEKIGAEAIAIYDDLLAHMDKGYDSPEVQQAIGRWHQHIRYFYEPTVDILRGLGQGYAEDPQFAAFYRKMHPDMPEFLRQAITYYCERLSTD